MSEGRQNRRLHAWSLRAQTWCRGRSEARASQEGWRWGEDSGRAELSLEVNGCSWGHWKGEARGWQEPWPSWPEVIFAPAPSAVQVYGSGEGTVDRGLNYPHLWTGSYWGPDPRSKAREDRETAKSLLHIGLRVDTAGRGTVMRSFIYSFVHSAFIFKVLQQW